MRPLGEYYTGHVATWWRHVGAALKDEPEAVRLVVFGACVSPMHYASGDAPAGPAVDRYFEAHVRPVLAEARRAAGADASNEVVAAFLRAGLKPFVFWARPSDPDERAA